MPNEKITVRLWKDALAKFNDEMAHYRGDRPPKGAFLSQLILKCPEKVWRQVRESMDVVYEDWED